VTKLNTHPPVQHGQALNSNKELKAAQSLIQRYPGQREPAPAQHQTGWMVCGEETFSVKSRAIANHN